MIAAELIKLVVLGLHAAVGARSGVGAALKPCAAELIEAEQLASTDVLGVTIGGVPVLAAEPFVTVCTVHRWIVQVRAGLRRRARARGEENRLQIWSA